MTHDVTPELLVCTAVVRCGLVDGAGASILLGPADRIWLAATDETFAHVAEMQFSAWEGPGPDVVQSGLPVYVDDLHTQADRWPLTTPHAATTEVRAVATFPLTTRHGPIGLFAVYRTSPGPFGNVDRAQLRSVAATLGVLVGTRFDDEGAVHLPASTLNTAVGMAAVHLGVRPADALALLRARAFALSVSALALADDLVTGTRQVEELLDRPHPPQQRP